MIRYQFSGLSNGIIVGGGVIGMSIAWELSRRGHQILLLDRQSVGHGTSWAAAGILPPANRETATDPIDTLRGLSHQRFPDWHAELLRQTAIDSGFRRCGAYYLGLSAGEKASLVGMSSFWQDQRMECEPVSIGLLGDREPSLGHLADFHPKVAAWYVPDECQVRPPRLLQALRQVLNQQKVTINEQATVRDIHVAPSHVEVVWDHKRAAADYVVLCGGAWTGQLAANFGLDHWLVPVRGQMLLLKSDTPSLQRIINVGHRYLVPREDGYTLVGSTEEEVGFALGTTERTLQSLHQFAIQLCPSLKQARTVKSWSGLRPMPYDGFPIIGAVPGAERVFVATGHFRSGIHLSPGTAEVVANLIEGRENSFDVTSFRVDHRLQRINVQTHPASTQVLSP